MTTWIIEHCFLFFFLTWNSILAESTGEIRLTIPALGRSAHLGYLYDAVRDEIIGQSIFKDNTPNESFFIKTIQIPQFNNKFDVPATLADKFQLFDIDPNTAVNILSKLTKPEGSSKFLGDTLFSPEKHSSVLLYEYKSFKQDLLIFLDSFKELCNRNVLLNEQATHIVTSITWGANVAINIDSKTSNEYGHTSTFGNENEQKHLLQENLYDLPKMFLKENLTHEHKTLFPVYTDISSQNNTISKFKTRKQIRQLLHEMPQLIQDTNGGKGVPIRIKLTPISFLRDYLEIQIEHKQVLQTINNGILREFIDIFDEVARSKVHLHELQKKLKSQPNCVPTQTSHELDRIHFEFTKFVKKFQYDFQNALVQNRLGESNSSSLSNLSHNYYSSEFNLQNLHQSLNIFEGALEKSNFCKYLKTFFPSVEYFGEKLNMDDRILQTMSQVPIYAMFTKAEFIKEKQADYRKVSTIFFHNLNKPYNKLFIIDCDFAHPHCDLVNQTVIRELKNGKFTSRDIVAESEDLKILKPIERAAIGRFRFVQMGELYNARTDNFLGASLLSAENENSSVEFQTLNTSELIKVPYANKLESFNADPELQFSILAGLVPHPEDDQYFELDQEKKTFRFVQRSAFSKIKNVSHAIEQGLLELHLLHNTKVYGPATHFVSQIISGSTTIFSVKESTETKDSDFGLEKLEQALHEFLKYNFQDKLESNEMKKQILWENLKAQISEIEVFRNIFDQNESFSVLSEMKTNENQLLDYLKGIFQQRKEQPIAYVLHPITNLKHFGIFRDIVLYNSLSSTGEDPKNFEDILSKIQKANDNIEELNLLMKENSKCITDTDIENMNSINELFNLMVRTFKREFKDTIIRIRSGTLPPKELQKLKERFNNHFYFKADGKYKELNKMSIVEEKINLLKTIKNLKNIKYIGRLGSESEDSIDQIFMERSFKPPIIYILFYKPEWTYLKEREWSQCIQLFFGHLNNANANVVKDADHRKLYFINCEFNHLHCGNLTEPTIHKYKQGKLVSSNFFKSEKAAKSQLEKQIQEINSTVENNRMEIESMRNNVDNNNLMADLNNNKIQTLMTLQASNDISTQDTNRFFGAVLNSTIIVNRMNLASLHNNFAARNTTVARIIEDIDQIKKKQDIVKSAAQGNKNLIRAILNSTDENYNEMVLLHNEGIARNATVRKISDDFESLTSGLLNVSIASMDNEHKIPTLESGLRNVTNKTSENSETIEKLVRNSQYCVFEENVTRSLAQVHDARNLTCGGLVNVPSSGSMILMYKPNVNPGQEQRCLWTLRSTHNSKIYQHRLKFSLLCDKLGNSGDILTFHEWHAGYNDGNVTFFDLRSKTGQLLPSDNYKYRHFLYLNSKHILPGVEFIVQVDVLASLEENTELSWLFDTVPGQLDYDQYKIQRSLSIAVVPPKTRAIQLTVGYVNSDPPNGVCYGYRSLDVYELGERGIPRRLGRLCGSIINTISYSTEFPVFAVFHTGAGSVGTFKVSWK